MLVASWPAPGRATNFTVPGSAATIRDAIALAKQSTDTSDTITVSSNTYTENLVITKSLTLQAKDGAKVILQAAVSGDPLIRADGPGVSVTLQRLILVTGGAGVVVNNVTAILRNLVIRSAATAIDCRSLTASTIEQVTFYQATKGIACSNSTVTIQNNIFANFIQPGVPISLIGTPGGVTLPNRNLFFQSPGGERGSDEVTTNDPDLLFVDPVNNNFHLQAASAARRVTTSIDPAQDLGAYGGPNAPSAPFPPGRPDVTCDAASPATCTIIWPKNLDYVVTGYLVSSSAPSAPAPDYSTVTPLSADTTLCPDTTCRTTIASLAEFSSDPARPLAPTARVGDGKLELSWPAVTDATAYEVYWATTPDAVTLGTPNDTASTNQATANGLINGTPYYLSLRAISRPALHVAVQSLYGAVAVSGKASEFSETESEPYGTPLYSPRSPETEATPQAVVGFPPLEETGGCFIATAAYGSAMAPQVQALRTWRDRYLVSNSPGRAFIRFYETWSPPAADVIRRSDTLRSVARFLLWPLVGFAELWVRWPWLPGVATMAIAVLAFGFWKVRAMSRA